MQFGLHLGLRGPAAAPDSLPVIATEAEKLGFLHLGVSDHVVIASAIHSHYPYTRSGRWFAEDSGECLEQLTTLGFLAAATRHIRLLTSVMVLPHRPPLLAAKMLKTIDILSAGRLTAGVGVGWMAEEIALLGGPAFAQRGRAADEFIAAFRALWTEDSPRYHGDHVSFAGLKFAPKPVQSPHPPIWIGGETAPARRRAGRAGDGWYPVDNNPRARLDSPARYADGVRDMQAAARAAGRDPEKIARCLLAIGYRLGNEDRDQDGERRRFTGSADAVCDDIHAFEGAGLQQLVIGGESNDLSQCLDRMREFEDKIMRHIHRS